MVLCLAAVAYPADSVPSLMLATTTSVDNSGLLAYLLPQFEKHCGCRVRSVVTGSGKALAIARSGDVDVIVSHSPTLEANFIKDGFGEERQEFMYNYFVLLGPRHDPAGVGQSNDVLQALDRIRRAPVRFISRGDESGTHNRERLLWQKLYKVTGVTTDFEADWYVLSGLGMARSIMMADELEAYVLSDAATYRYLSDRVDLQVFGYHSPMLLNTYSVIPVSHALHSHVKATLAAQFAKWLTSEATGKRIDAYQVGGEQLFFASVSN